MKKLLLLTLLFASCDKDETICYDCVTITKTSVNYPTPGYPQTTTSTFESCSGDKTGSTTSTASQGSITATSVATTICTQK